MPPLSARWVWPRSAVRWYVSTQNENKHRISKLNPQVTLPVSLYCSCRDRCRARTASVCAGERLGEREARYLANQAARLAVLAASGPRMQHSGDKGRARLPALLACRQDVVAVSVQRLLHEVCTVLQRDKPGGGQSSRRLKADKAEMRAFGTGRQAARPPNAFIHFRDASTSELVFPA